MKSPTLALVAAAAAVLLSGAANAAVVSLSGMTAEWYDGNPSGNVSYSGQNSVAPKARWGDPATNAGQSGYNFDIANQPINFTVPPTPAATQVIGTFTHINQPIYAGSSITDIKLQLSATVTVKVDGNVVSASPLLFNYSFNHWETGNSDEPCADGGTDGVGVNINGCADRVIATWLPSSNSFKIGDEDFTLNVFGFSTDIAGTNPFVSFWTKEDANNSAFLVANVTYTKDAGVPPDEIPEPATLPLLALALAGLYATRRAKAKKN